jgi:hypothetical protein
MLISTPMVFAMVEPFFPKIDIKYSKATISYGMQFPCGDNYVIDISLLKSSN